MAALDSPGGGSCSFCLGLWLPCPTSPIPLGPSRGCAGTGKGVAAALLHLEAVAPSQGLERGWAPRSPALVGGGSTATPRPHVLPAARAFSLWARVWASPGPHMPGQPLSFSSGRSPNSPRTFLLFSCCCWAFGTLLSPLPAG